VVDVTPSNWELIAVLVKKETGIAYDEYDIAWCHRVTAVHSKCVSTYFDTPGGATVLRVHVLAPA
jgi:hypothetical protein